MLEDRVMEPEVLFLRYAVPCAFQLVMSKKITEDERHELELAAIEGRAVSMEKIDRIFSAAHGRRDRLYGDKLWSPDFVGKYWREDHNEIIARLEQPDSAKDLCMVHKAEVISVGDLMVVKYVGSELLPESYRGERRRSVKKVFLPDVRIGDRVTIHWNYAVELLEKNKKA
jgi:hypothetical protein